MNLRKLFEKKQSYILEKSIDNKHFLFLEALTKNGESLDCIMKGFNANAIVYVGVELGNKNNDCDNEQLLTVDCNTNIKLIIDYAKNKLKQTKIID